MTMLLNHVIKQVAGLPNHVTRHVTAPLDHMLSKRPLLGFCLPTASQQHCSECCSVSEEGVSESWHVYFSKT